MDGRERPRRGLFGLLLLALLGSAAAFWLPTWWERRTYRAAEAIAGVEAPLRQGDLTAARKKVESGASAEAVRAALGSPSLSAASEGTSRHDIWTYYYADGTLTVNLTDGFVVRIGTKYGAPKIPSSRRPRNR